MKRIRLTLCIFACLATLGSAQANIKSESIWIGSYGSISSWKPVARDELILWTSPRRAYLVKIWRPASDLRFANAIAVTDSAGRITKFDRVIVRGQRVPIRSIQRIDAKTARSLRYRNHRS